jgi:hypothetical protein
MVLKDNLNSKPAWTSLLAGFLLLQQKSENYNFGQCMLEL